MKSLFYMFIFLSKYLVAKSMLETRVQSFRLALIDHISKNGIIQEYENIQNLIHCATNCLQAENCKGFGYESNKLCSLLNIYMENNYCSKEDCLSREGIKVYMVILYILHFNFYLKYILSCSSSSKKFFTSETQIFQIFTSSFTYKIFKQEMSS